jgi:hypothetical protein
MSMIPEVAAFKLEFNADSLLLARSKLTFRFAIRKARLHRFHQIPQLSRHHAEEENHPVLIHWGMAKTTEINRITIGWAVGQP